MKTVADTRGVTRTLPIGGFFSGDDRIWLVVWLCGILCLILWDLFFLNAPAFERVQLAVMNTFVTCLLVVLFSLALGWGTAFVQHFLESRFRPLSVLLTFLLNIIRSIPQIVGILIGYILLTLLIEQEIILSRLPQLFWMAFVISLFLFLEVVDLIKERIGYFRRRDFFPAMLCCGISEGRIINREILWKNSRTHLFHKMVSIFGAAVFLQCSIDFIVSVGLSTDVSLSNFPVTLGNMLATIDSKQDILAIGTSFRDLSRLPSLLFEHLQGVSIAFIIVFTLLCIYKISNGIVTRYRL